MTYAPNLWSDVSSISNSLLEGAYHIVREQYQMQNFVTVKMDMTGANPRKSFKYNSLTAVTIGENDDMVSEQFKPTADQTLTPIEIGVPAFISDLRIESDAPEDIMRDTIMELGMAAGDNVETALITDMASLTGGTIGAAGTAITWGYVGAAIAVARNANKSPNVPLVGVVHGYQAAVLAKSASIAGATTVAAPGVADQMTRQGFGQVFTYQGVPIYQVFASPDTNTDFTGGVFPKLAIAIDWRRRLRIEGERKASRRGWQYNMTAVYAHGVWRPELGVKMVFDATAPSS